MTMPEEPQNRDDLTLRFREASAEDERRPSDRVREAAHVHARMLIAANRQVTANPALKSVAANQPRWKVSMLASVAVVGLAGLLLLQFDHGTSQEKELVHGVPVLPRARVAAEPSARLEPVPETVPRAKSAAHSPALPAQQAAAQSVEPAPTAAPSPMPATARAPEPSGVLAARDRAEAETRATVSNRQSALADSLAQKQAGVSTAQARRAGVLDKSAAQPLSPLHEAARLGRVSELEHLLASGSPLNAPDLSGRTPLMLAVINGHTDSVQRLLAAGANPALVDHEGMTALQHARRLGLANIARLLEAAS